MAFTREAVQTPVSVGWLQVTLYRADPDKPNDTSSAGFRLVVRYDNGESRERSGDLWPHLTAQERTQLTAFVESLYSRAAAAILPE